MNADQNRSRHVDAELKRIGREVARVETAVRRLRRARVRNRKASGSRLLNSDS